MKLSDKTLYQPFINIPEENEEFKYNCKFDKHDSVSLPDYLDYQEFDYLPFLKKNRLEEEKWKKIREFKSKSDCTVKTMFFSMFLIMVPILFLAHYNSVFENLKKQKYNCNPIKIPLQEDYDYLSSTVNRLENEINVLKKYLTPQFSSNMEVLQIIENLIEEYNKSKIELNHQNLYTKECNENISRQHLRAFEIQKQNYIQSYYIFIFIYAISILIFFCGIYFYMPKFMKIEETKVTESGLRRLPILFISFLFFPIWIMLCIPPMNAVKITDE